MLIGMTDPARAAAADEARLRAAVISGIIHYTEWVQPGNAKLCIAGLAPSGDSLMQAAAKIHVHNLPATVEALAPAARIETCEVLIIGALSDNQTRLLLGQLKPLPDNLLVICDNCDPQKLPADIELLVNDNRIGFAITERKRPPELSFRAALLELATSIRRTER